MPTLRSLTLCDSMLTLPACLGEFNLHYLRLKYFKHVNNLPGICVRLTSLETLHIESCATLQELPSVSLMTSLTSLILHKCALIGLPCLESLAAMRHLSLSDLIHFTWLPCLGGMSTLRHLSLVDLNCLVQLPLSISKLTSLRELRFERCDGITDLPSMCEMWSLEDFCISKLDSLQKLPACMDAPTALHTLDLTFLENLEKLINLSSSILGHTALTELTMDLWFTDLSFIESMTRLRSLSICVFEEGISTLACALPALHLLQYLSINKSGLSNDAVVVICCSLKAWPLPSLVDFDYSQDIGEICCKALTLPPLAAGWTNTAVLQHWRVQQHKLMAFGSGLYWRLGVASAISLLNDTIFLLIADEVLGCISLLRRWQRELLSL